MRSIKLDAGDRVVVFSEGEFEALGAAVEVAFDDPESVPEEYREAGQALREAFIDEASAPLRTPFLKNGFADESTGGGCRALAFRFDPDNLEVLATDDDANLPRFGSSIVVGVWDTTQAEKGQRDFLTSREYEGTPQGALRAIVELAGLLSEAKQLRTDGKGQ